MPDQLADRNLLFGIVALQLEFITRDALIAGMNAWGREQHRPLGEILVDRGDLLSRFRDLLEPMVDAHMERHAGDPIACLTSLGTTADFAEVIRQSLDDSATLSFLTSRPPNPSLSLPETQADDPYATRMEDPYATRADSSQYSESSFGPKRPPAGVRYRKLRDHAKGGLGVVFVAQDVELNREVALKEIQDRHADHPASRARFLIEAEITGGLEHPGIVPVYGLGSYADGRPFYAMRFIRGDSLKDAIAAFHANETLKDDPGARALALQKLLRRFLDVCDAIAYAHSRGVLHRDLKPENVMVGQFGETLVVDWGMAKAAGSSGAELDDMDAQTTLNLSATDSSHETLPGSVIGTPAYMSPEQAAGRLDLLGPASDVYSLGATLYTLLTGASPVTGQTLAEVLANVQAGRFSRPRELDRRLDPSIEAVCLKAMALRPEDRYASPRELADDLESWLAEEPVSAIREPWTRRLQRWSRRHRTAVTAASSTVLVAAVLLGIFQWVSRDRIRRTDAASLVTLTKAEQLEIEARATSDLLQWEAALAEASRAESQLESGGGSADLKRRVAAKLAAIRAEELQVRTDQAARERNRKAVADLEEARLLRATTKDDHFDPTPQHEAFLAAFRSYGVDVAKLSVEDAAERVRSSAIAIPLIAALDEWSLDTSTIVPMEKLEAIARKADPDSGMSAIRDAAAHRDPAELRRLIEASKTRPEWVVRTNPFVRILAGIDPTASLPFLESIRRERPADFWINHTLAEAYENGNPARLDEATRYYAVAAALRPGSAAIYVNLGTALRKKGDPDGAIVAQREAIRLKPDYADAYIGLGNALADKRDIDGCIAAEREAIRLRPESGMAYNNLGNGLNAKNDLNGALAAYRESVRLGYPLGHYSLGCALREKKDLDASITSLREAARLMPNMWKARYMLGNVLMDKQDWTGAITAYRESLRLNPIDPETLYYLGNALRNQGQLDAAAEAFRMAIKFRPDYPEPLCNLGLILMRQGFPTEGLKSLERGHELGSRNNWWRYPSAEWVKSCRRLAGLEAKLPAIRKGESGPSDPDDALALANLCYDRKLFATSARLLGDAFTARPQLAEDVRTSHRYNAARTAALAGTGQGQDDPRPDETARLKLRDKARDWLRADLTTWSRIFEGGNPEALKAIVQALTHWKANRDLAGIRDEDSLAKLPEPERKSFQALWADVEALLKKASGG